MIIVTDGSNKHVITPTIFPDGTSQVWKLPEWAVEKDVKVTWFFENEAEIFHLMQLNRLVNSIQLNVPFLPYARQDKVVSNDSTFARSVFEQLLNSSMFNSVVEVKTVDVHSNSLEFLYGFKSRDVVDFHHYALSETRPTYVVFPDAGAAKRYEYLKELPHIVFEKVRDQTTGNIISHTPVNPVEVKSGDSFLMVDDLCDGGATFCSISKTLHGIKQNIGVHLAVTHGLFSKGKHVLGAARISEILTTNTLLRNKDEFKVV